MIFLVFAVYLLAVNVDFIFSKKLFHYFLKN